MRKDVMVELNKDGKWSVRTTGASKAVKLFTLQKDASKFGRELAKKNQSEFRLKDKSGKVREKILYTK
ncbi:MAG: DUF2188 domain-containing protein [Mycoplasmatales bacterium]|nr:DUF2188 domain-containing protein [Mycoplasmatales bacterium]